jgi:serine phosphatase RsbU (regulator of sigma subunit)
MRQPPRRPGQSGYIRPGQSRRDAPARRGDTTGRRDGASGRREVDPRRGTSRIEGRRTTVGGGPRPQRRPLPQEVLLRLDSDPLYQVMTSDQQYWIDPYTAQPIPASLGRIPAAKEYLMESAVWREKEPLPRVSLDITKWRMDLVRLLPIEPRLRIFGKEGKGWMNPFTGDLVPNIVRDDGKITARTVNAMAQHLATCPQATGKPLDNQALLQRMQALGIAPPQAKPTTATLASEVTPVGNEMAEDMARARSVQQNMLADLPELEGYEVAIHYAGHSGVSGDFYEALTLRDGRVLLLLGDVSGHGMQAALVVATALKTLRFLARQTNDLSTLLTQFNDEIRADLLPGQFITLFAGILDPGAREMTCLRAGHHPAIIVNLAQSAPLRKVGNQGMAIGLVSGAIFSRSLKPETVILEPGDVLVQYTDGATEASNVDGDEYGDHRLYGAVLTRFDMNMQELVDSVAEDVMKFAGGGLDDDLTLFALAVLEPEEEDETEADVSE